VAKMLLEVNGLVKHFAIKRGLFSRVTGYVHAVDGISLTVNDCDDAGFTVSIVPHTGRVTTIGFKQIGAPVNIETDMIGKYVEKFMTGSKIETTGKGKAGSGVDMDLLAKTGFL